MTKCPCCSKKDFEDCCQPVLKNQSAPTALALMRSRYTAYHLGDDQYLYQTTHVKTRTDYSLKEIEKWAADNTWTRLEIIDTERGQSNDDRGVVEFKAYFTDDKQKPQVHHERSAFLKEESGWYYVDGTYYG